MSTELDIQVDLAKGQEDAVYISGEAVAAYTSRCAVTQSECEGLHYSACRSRLPSGECTTDEMTDSQCLENSCGGVQDLSNPVVQIPDGVQDADGNVVDPDVIETICYQTILDSPLIERFKESQSSTDTVPSVHTYFGSWNGVMRIFPGRQYEIECGDYDPRIRPWYVAASSGPKDVVIIVDRSSSMNDNDRFELAKGAVESVLDTMNEHTFVNIVVFDSSAEVLTSDNELVAATDDNKEMLVNLLANVQLGGATNYEEALTTTFSLLEASRALGNLASSECSTAILLLTDGEITAGAGPTEISTVVETLNDDIGAQLFTFALGDEADSATLKSIACGTGGIFQQIPDAGGGALANAMAFYYRYYAIGLGSNTDYTAYSSIYEFSTSGKLGFTVASPAYDQTSEPPTFLGVSGVDYTLQSYLDAGFSQSEIEEAVFLGGKECPTAAFNLTYCQLQQFRGSISSESVCVDDGGCTFDTASLEPVRCMDEDEYPDNLWSNVDLAEFSYLERECCASDVFDPSVAAATCEAPGTSPTDTPTIPIVIGCVVAVVAIALIVFGVKRYRAKPGPVPAQSHAQ